MPKDGESSASSSAAAGASVESAAPRSAPEAGAPAGPRAPCAPLPEARRPTPDSVPTRPPTHAVRCEHAGMSDRSRMRAPGLPPPRPLCAISVGAKHTRTAQQPHELGAHTLSNGLVAGALPHARTTHISTAAPILHVTRPVSAPPPPPTLLGAGDRLPRSGSTARRWGRPLTPPPLLLRRRRALLPTGRRAEPTAIRRAPRGTGPQRCGVRRPRPTPCPPRSRWAPTPQTHDAARRIPPTAPASPAARRCGPQAAAAPPSGQGTHSGGGGGGTTTWVSANKVSPPSRHASLPASSTRRRRAVDRNVPRPCVRQSSTLGGRLKATRNSVP